MPKIVDKESKKLEISLKAMKVFVSKGFERTKIQDIADAAGIGKGTIYEYFKTKEEIIIHSILAFFGEMEKAMGDFIMTASDPREKLKKIVMDSIEIGLQDEDIWIVYTEIWYYNMRGSYQAIKNLFQQFLSEFRGLIAGIIDEGKKMGIFREDVDSYSIAAYIAGSLDGVGIHYLMDKGSMDVRKVAEDSLNAVIKGIEK